MARIGDRSEMEAFVRAVDLGSFSAAARELKLTPSALSKLVNTPELKDIRNGTTLYVFGL